MRKSDNLSTPKKKISNMRMRRVISYFVQNRWFVGLGIIGVVIILVVIVPIIINELYKIKDGYITLWTAADVLAFYSVVLSGIITIGALIATIYYSRKETERQIKATFSQTNVPFFVIKKVFFKNNREDFLESEDRLNWTKEYVPNEFASDNVEISIELENIGDGIALSPISSIETNQTQSQFFLEKLPQFIVKDGNFILDYMPSKIIIAETRSAILCNHNSSFISSIILKYQNTWGVSYSQTIELQHEWVYKQNKIIIKIGSISPHQNIH